jgi:glutamate 5-kinase
VILSDVEGLYDRDPQASGAQVMRTVARLDESVMALARDRLTGISKGGMASKLRAAQVATAAGENVIIASGRQPGTLRRIFAGEEVGTLFLAQGGIVAARKRWIGLTAQPRGHLVLDDGARAAIEQRGTSLLAIGVVDAVGNFHKGDVVALRDRQGVEVARGLTNYSAAEVHQIKGRRSEEIGAVLGHCPYHEVIHCNNLLVTTHGARA